MANVTRLVPTRSAELLIECQKLASERLPGPLKTVLEKVDDALFELANRADNSQRQNQYFDAMRELRLKRDSFEAKFIGSFNTQFEDSAELDKARKQAARFAPEMELALVEPDEVEQSLAVTNFVESVTSKCKEQLYALDRRMGYLLSRPDLVDDDNPLGPRVIGSAFRAACEQLESDVEVKLTLFKMFDKFAGPGIQQMYRDLNDHLVMRDVLPKITTTARPSGGTRRTRVTIETEEENVEGPAPDVFSTLQGLMTNATRGHGGSIGFNGGAGFGAGGGSSPGGAASSGVPGAAPGGYPGFPGMGGTATGSGSPGGHGGGSELGGSGAGAVFGAPGESNGPGGSGPGAVFGTPGGDSVAGSSAAGAVIGAPGGGNGAGGSGPGVVYGAPGSNSAAGSTAAGAVIAAPGGGNGAGGSGPRAVLAVPGSGTGVVGGPVALGTAYIVDTLTLLQQGDPSGLQETAAATFNPSAIEAGNVNVLRTLRETGAIGAMNQTDSLTLDIVSILFDYVLDDAAIPDAMKTLIGRLQIPMLKVALLDKALFSKKTHPARRLVDALAAAAVGWSETHSSHDGLYELVETIVRRIVDEFEEDISLFENALVELQTYLDEERDEADRRAAESTRSLRTRERIVLAKMAVDDAINDRIAGLEMREFIRQFIVDYWRQLLIITHVEHGTDSEIWQDQLRTVDELVWSIQDKSTPQDRKALTEKLPRMLKNIKRGMATLEMEPKTCSKFLSMLASVHVVSVKHTEEAGLAERHLLRDEKSDEPLTPADANNEEFIKQGLARLFERNGVDSEELDIDLSVFEDPSEAESEAEELSPDIMEYVEQVTELDLGDWVEFDNDDGSSMRARFTWISPATGRYLFTTRQGQKALDTTLMGLADQFARETAHRVATQPDPIFDRAIGDLIDKLESQQATA